MRNKGITQGLGLAVALGALLQMGGPALAREHIEQQLDSPSGARAAGRARVVMHSDSDGRLVLKVRGLAPDQSYDVLVGNVKVGTLQTTGGGGGAVRFRTQPRGHDLMLGFDPHGALITIRSASGEDVLIGSVPTSPGGSADNVVCCVPDDRGAECEDRTADECTAQGGTVVAATSCLPNPCADAPPTQTDVVCCIPDDSGNECEDRTPAECAAQGGLVVSATSCTDNPCAATPPADPEVRCCLPDDSGAECEDRTSAQCAAQGGIDLGPGSCTPNPCAGAAPATLTANDASGHGGSGGHHGQDAGGDRGHTGGTYYGVPTAP